MFKESSQRMINVSISQMVNTWFRVTHVTGARKSKNIQMMLLVSNARKCMFLQNVRNKLPQHERDTDFTAEYAHVGPVYVLFFSTVMVLEFFSLSIHSSILPSFHPSFSPSIHHPSIYPSFHPSIHPPTSTKKELILQGKKDVGLPGTMVVLWNKDRNQK